MFIQEIFRLKFWYNLKLSIFSIYENPLGWGFQNYSNAHEYLSNKYLEIKKILTLL